MGNLEKVSFTDGYQKMIERQTMITYIAFGAPDLYKEQKME